MRTADDIEMLVNPFSSDSSGFPRSQNIKKVASESDSEVQKAFDICMRHAQKRREDRESNISRSFPVLDPSQIDRLAHMIMELKDEGHELYGLAGRYLSALIEESFNKGSNGFHITNGDTWMHDMPYWLQPIERLPNLEYHIHGISTNPYKVTGCKGIYEGYVSGSDPFSGCRHSHFIVRGGISRYSCSKTYGCKFEFYGEVGDDLGDRSSNCIYIFHTNDLGSFCISMKNCQFRTEDEELFRYLGRFVLDINQNNRAQLIDKKGSIIKEVVQ